MKNIALIGFMGSGKSTVAAILAKKLGWEWREIDNDILCLTEHSSINAIFENLGEVHFRELETKSVMDAVKKSNQVISCGGGVVASPEAMAALQQNSIIVFLHADFKTITQRLIHTDSRPLFRDMEKAAVLYAQRLPLYKKHAVIEVMTDELTPDETADAIIREIKKQPHSTGGRES